LKHNPNRALLEGKNIVLIDDSIVRGTTMKKLVCLLKDNGVKNIHIKIASPQVMHPCFYGIDTPDKKGLISANHDVDYIREFLGVDSLYFISIDGVYKALSENFRDSKNPQFCDACFTGDYPV